jgi:uncharacterized protein YcbX
MMGTSRLAVLEAQRELRSASKAVGRVEELWRYPVKSMLGERRDTLLLTPQGIVGDRVWALRDLATGRIASAKKFPKLLQFSSYHVTEPQAYDRGEVLIDGPDGATFSPVSREASAFVSDVLGRQVKFESQPKSSEKTSIDRATVFGDVPVSQMKSDWTPETMPDYFQLRKGTFFEVGPVFVLASGSVQHLRALQGGTALIDRRRFRPNIYIDSGPPTGGFVEDEWLGGMLTIGSDVALAEFAPTLWCSTSTLAQEELPRDLSILRTAAEHHKGCLGVYAEIESAGRLNVGDPVTLLK